MLTFVGLGLYDERSVTVAGRDAIRSADRVFAEFYTSFLPGATVPDLEAYHDTAIEVRDRAGVEQDPTPILDAAERGEAVFLTAGDTMIATTHVDLRLRAHDRGIDTRVIGGPTAQAAASALTGLQNYRFGKATTIPFPASHGGDAVPDSVVETIAANRERDLHTLSFLDIRAEEEAYMSAAEGATHLRAAGVTGLGVAVCRAGSPDPVVVAGALDTLADRAFGPPLHLLVLPGSLHDVEREALDAFADGDVTRR